jgi:exopolysaccharide biosynthesis operon protein EpsL
VKNKQHNAELNRALRLIYAALGLGTLIGLTAANAATLQDEFLKWPSLGSYPAYPLEPDDRKIIAFANVDAALDDNLFRISDDDTAPILGIAEREDRYIKAGLGIHSDLEFSRQRLTIDASGDRYMFDRFSELDRWVYSGAFNWHYEVGDRARGDIGYTYALRLPNFSELQFASDDAIRQRYAHASLNLRVLSRVELRGLAEETRVDHDDEFFATLDNRVRAGTLGLVYVSPTMWTVGAQHKTSRGDYPNRETIGTNIVDNEYRENESSIIVNKVFDEPGGFDLRIGRTERKHEEVSQRDFDGMTGRAHLRYAPTAKVSLDAAAYRELRAIEELSASYAVVNGGTIGPAWAPTEKLVLQASYVYERREFAGDPGFVFASLPPREDTSRGVRVGAGYEPNKHFRVGLSFERGTRSANVALADYEYNLAVLRIVGSL